MTKNLVEKICENCENQFLVEPYRSNAAVFCSLSCLWAGRKKRPRKRTLISKVCENCGTDYQVAPSREKRARFCSHRCTFIDNRPSFERKRALATAESRRRRAMTAEDRRAKKRASDAVSYRKHKDKRAASYRTYYENNKERHAAASRAWAAKNLERCRQLNARKRLLKGDALRAARRQHYRDNKHRYIANARRREADKLKATAKWADLEKIAEFYREAERLTQETGIRHHVDHIIPLRGKNVCGLHVETNLQVITAIANARKSNFFEA